MKILIKIFIVLSLAAGLNSCGAKQEAGADPTHDSTKDEAGVQKEAGPEAASMITSLTEEQIKAAGITLGDMEQKNLTAVIKANGALRVPNNNKANATSLYGGVIKTLKVQLGDYVRKGQVIATIENPQFIQLQEEYLTLGSRILLAGQEMQRQRELNEGNAGAIKNLQSATAELNALRTRKASLQKQIQLMGINPNRVSNTNLQSALLVTSPVNGTVSNEFAKIGSYVDVSSPVVEIVDNGLLHLDLQVFEKDLPFIKEGQVVNFVLTNNPSVTYTAKVFKIGSSFENESKTIAVHCTVTGNKKGLIDGMNITGMISAEHVMAPAVPNEAIVEADGKFYIFVQTEKAAAKTKVANHDDHGHAPDEGEAAHKHSNEQEAATHAQQQGKTLNFEKIEVAKGVSEMGYTAITPVSDLAQNVKVVTKGAFFINAKLSSGGHNHAH
ncbi:MAG: efflux RND transporter periplasmic adaptor subunit [Sphingobacteriales bacterium]|nr:MAG: efflux RND transporter periplasmic adaptor subunit [Sphingobacteriales bacterium]